MEIRLKNVGIICDSTIKMEGLTVITGKNNSGKTTVGKALYAIVQANYEIEYTYELAKVKHIKTQLFKIWKILIGRRQHNFRVRTEDNVRVNLDTDAILCYLGDQKYRNDNPDSLKVWLDRVIQMLPELTVETLSGFLIRHYRYLGDTDEYYRMLSENFEDWKKEVIKIAEHTSAIIYDQDSFMLFRRDQVRKFLNDGFKNQVVPIRALEREAEIHLTAANKRIMDVLIRNKEDIELMEGSSMVLPIEQGLFIDDPYILDRIDLDERFTTNSNFEQDDESIPALDIPSYREHLKRLLLIEEKSDFFDALEFQKKHQSIVNKINSIVPGEFQMSNDGFFYVNDGVQLDVQNMATGSKLFFIIKQLFVKGYLNEKTVMILDEPESHLHPEWINKLAEILVLMINEIGVNVLITTHSPNLLLSLNVFAKKYSIINKSHFYLAKKKEDSWEAEIEGIDDDIDEGYAHLSIPLIEMTVEQDIVEKERNGN